MLQYLLVVSFGLAVGSFLNVVMYRLPRGESIAFPPSHCPHCGTSILYRDNVPLLGFLLLGGKCRSCKTGISLRYPLIEGITGCMFGILYYLHGPSLPFLSQVILGSILLTAVVIDLQFMIVPDRLMMAGGTFGGLISLAYGWPGLIRALSGALSGITILAVMSGIGWLIYRRESIGWGDFKLVAVTGLFLGPLFNSVALALAVVFGGIWGILLLIGGINLKGREIPFVPFIAAGCLVSMLFGGELLRLFSAYLQLYRW